MNKNTLRKAALIKEMVDEMYEPGNQRKSKIQIFRNHISKVYPMSECTFWRMMSAVENDDKCKASIFDDPDF